MGEGFAYEEKPLEEVVRGMVGKRARIVYARDGVVRDYFGPITAFDKDEQSWHVTFGSQRRPHTIDGSAVLDCEPLPRPRFPVYMRYFRRTALGRYLQ